MERKDPPATLFRSTLYAPLAAYQQTRISPADYTRTATKVSKELQESSLYKFLQHVSSHHHAKPTQLHAKNTSAKPLKDYAERIQQRALNLVGVDFYGGTKAKAQSANSKATKRRRQSRRKFRFPGADEMQPHKSYLEKLNKLWNEYASKVIKEKAQVAPAINEIEWVGALVRIDSCPAFRDWQGCQGFVVHHTNKSWHVCTKGWTQNTKKKEVNKLLYLPKTTTSLTVMIPKSTGGPGRKDDSKYLYAVIRGENSK